MESKARFFFVAQVEKNPGVFFCEGLDFIRTCETNVACLMWILCFFTIG